MSETVKRYWLRLDDIGGHEYMVRASEYDALATRLAEAEAWLDEVATLCVTAERRAAELEAVIEQRNGECVSLHARVAELEAELNETQADAMVTAKDVRRACIDAVEVFSEQPDADQCRQVAEYMREVLLALIDRRKHLATPPPPPPPPAPEVAGLVEALEAIYDSDPQVPHPASESDVSMGQKMCIYRMRATAKAALAAYTQAKEGEA